MGGAIRQASLALAILDINSPSPLLRIFASWATCFMDSSDDEKTARASRYQRQIVGFRSHGLVLLPGYYLLSRQHASNS